MLLALSALVPAALAGPAEAGLIFDSTISITGEGFGNAPRGITIQETGNGDDIESVCISSTAGGLLIGGSGACLTGDATDGNGIINTGGDKVSLLSDNQKFGIPTLGELDYNSASDVRIVFNSVEPQAAQFRSINVTDLTLNSWTAARCSWRSTEIRSSATPIPATARRIFWLDKRNDVLRLCLNGTDQEQITRGFFKALARIFQLIRIWHARCISHGGLRRGRTTGTGSASVLFFRRSPAPWFGVSTLK